VSYEIVRAIARSRGGLSLVTIIDARGSVPRHPGSKMLVGRKGALLGTVGGGKGEALAIEAGRDCIARRRTQTLTVEMQGVAAEGQDLLCGGTNRMLVEHIGDTAMYRLALERLEKGERVLVVKNLEGSAALLDETGAPLFGESPRFDADAVIRCLTGGKPAFNEEAGIFYDPFFPEEKLLILGAGHVGQAIAVFAVKLDFTVTVADDRPEFTAAGRLPPGVRGICGSYTDIVEKFHFDSATYVVIVTRGHLHDLECLRAVLRRTWRYAGFIGSARKASLLIEQVRHDGLDAEKIDAVHAPIGLDIKAETPEEIAISILGELIAVRRSTGSEGALSLSRGRAALGPV
jgi:xanthine dehydrogenase accessory factor